MPKDTARHAGHRDRMRQKFVDGDAALLADHEILEMLLYTALPRRDTNDLAHRLIETFGSLAGVLEADPNRITALTGLGPNTACFLSLLGEAARRYAADKLKPKNENPVFDTPESVAKFLFPRFIGQTKERAYLLLFDNSMRLLDCFHVGDGSVGSVLMSVRRIAERAYAKQAAAAILAHNHPGGLAMPSGDDLRVTRQLADALELLEVPLIEHFVFTDTAYAPILCHYTPEEKAQYAASSLGDMLRARFHNRS